VGAFGVHLTLMKEVLSSWVKWKRMAGTRTIPWLPRLSGRKEMTKVERRRQSDWSWRWAASSSSR